MASIEITSEVPDPFNSLGKNLGGSEAVFLHGTTKKAIHNIDTDGFKAEIGRPTFSLSPAYSFSYCRKSESYLRGLISKGENKKLDIEISNLLKNGVITEEELKDTTHQWWISKADAYFQGTADITQDGVLLAFHFDASQITTPETAKLFIKEDIGQKIIYGPPSFWRTRQFAVTEIGAGLFNSDKIPQARITLNKPFVEAINNLTGLVKKGGLTTDSFELCRKLISENLQVEVVGSSFSNLEALADSFADQTVESCSIKLLRDTYIAKLKNQGLKIFWEKDRSLVEDPRWSLSQEEIATMTATLESNQWPKAAWRNYLTAVLSKSS